jgi:sulfatase maturation enzyme AslB (radical SAM superfamily)
MIVDKQKQSRHRSAQVTEHIAPLLPKLRLLYINNGGEFLFSRPSRELLQSIDAKSCPDLAIDLISNGTLFSESEWAKFANIHGRVRNIRISSDAATKETFEAVRRGGKWERFVDNLGFIGKLRQRREVHFFLMSFAYQLANFREIPAFVSFAKEVGADAVSFEPLLPSEAMTPAEFSERAVHLFAHPLHAEFRRVLTDPILSDSCVLADWQGNRA